ncbi:proteasome subunit RPN6 (RPN6) [Vairimorpha necatrix]|uniref:Proteasome subunit RPN6 (RPN6) n=1 Tax=Vairimorpha necatrix TaxID=6039 RepID=A0AAX4J9J5_9MICR
MSDQLRAILSDKNASQEEKEVAFLEIQKFSLENNDFDSLKMNIINIKESWSNITTARITKIIKKIFDMVPCDFATLENMSKVLDDLIEWATKDNKNLLRLDLECKRIYVYIYVSKYHEALTRIKEIAKDLKKFDDKNNLIGLYVYESKAFYKIKNFNRAKSSLTAARALAVSTYCSYELQAQIDLFNGMYLCDERNYKTAFSYFLESIEGFTIDKKYDYACISLRYLILSKIISKNQNEIDTIFKNKNATRHVPDAVVQLLIKIGKCCTERNLRLYLDLLNENKSLIENDEFMTSHLGYLYDILLENNILKIIESYSVIYLDFICKELNFEMNEIEKRVRKMILDKEINGILNHSDMSLILYDSKEDHSMEKDCLEQIKKLENICHINKC